MMWPAATQWAWANTLPSTTIGSTTVTTASFIQPIVPPDDDGAAGVREPRRPLPDPSGAQAGVDIPSTTAR